MSLRSTLYDDGVLRPIWRVMVFLALVVVGFLLGGMLVKRLLPRDPSVIVQLATYHGLLAASAALASAVMIRRVERQPLTALGVSVGALPRDFGRGALIGLVIVGGLVGIQLLFGWLRYTPEPGALLGWLTQATGLGLVLLIAAAAEELVFRGYALQVLVQALGPWPAVVASSVVFAGIHAVNPWVWPLALVNIAGAGVLLAVVYLRTWSLWAVIGLHWSWNWTMGVGFDLPVSGVDFAMPLYEYQGSGPAWLTGSGFGPEGGLLATFAILAASLWAVRSRWLRPAAAARSGGSLLGGTPDILRSSQSRRSHERA